jgi:hypothetical protein
VLYLTAFIINQKFELSVNSWFIGSAGSQEKVRTKKVSSQSVVTKNGQ